MDFELVLRRGRTFGTDASGGREVDIGIARGKIVAIGSNLPGKGREEVDCQEYVVTPGLIDMHVHAARGLSSSALDPDEIGVGTGVTTIVDAGSVGALLATAFAEHVVPQATTRVLGFMNIAVDPSYPSVPLADPANLSLAATLKQIGRHADIFRGIKVMASVTKVGVLGIEAIKVAKKAADLAGLPLVVHIGNPPPIIEDVLNVLTEGDVVTHCFHGKPGGLLNRKGEPIPEAWAALDRGVRFDIGHGSESFSFRVCERATQAGFPFHIVSSDLHVKNRQGPVYDLPTTMSKFLALGFPLEQVVTATTKAPAEVLGLASELGALKVGAMADLTVMRLESGEWEFYDSENNVLVGRERLISLAAIKGGQVVWQKGSSAIKQRKGGEAEQTNLHREFP